MPKKEKFLFRRCLFAGTGAPVFLLFVFLLSMGYGRAQSSNISGVINTYHSIVEIIPAKACIRVNNTTGLTTAETVMIIQMKGASVQTNNNANFGDTTALNNAGNYELGIICGIRGDSVFLFYNLLNNYTVGAKLQLVGVPTYYSAVVTDSLKALPWDNASGTGGVIALSVDENLTLNAPIYADGSGFSGGAYLQSNGTCSNLGAATAYIYNANVTNPQNGAFKGESVFDNSNVNFSGGRGAPANGGGGGNNHNNGGGGGANLGKGGDGGGNSSSTGCTTTLRGLGGKALGNWNGKKIFPGGGGGAGHSNNTISTGGGNGGGIIFIRTKNLISNNYKISANGLTGGGSVSDGAAGGGGGGTVIISAISYIGTMAIEAKGGNGGTANDGGNLKRCYGAGGGGGGGAIYFSGNTPAVPVSAGGGTAGPENGRDPACSALVPAIAGSTGIITPNYAYRTSLTPSAFCSFIPLPVGLIYFKALVSNQQQVLLQWNLSEPAADTRFVVERSSSLGQWTTLSIIPSTSISQAYAWTDREPVEGISFYRLKIIDAGNSFSYSSLQQVNIAPHSERINVFPNPAKDRLTIDVIPAGNTVIKLFSADGKLIFTRQHLNNPHSIQLMLPSLKTGIYLLQVNGQVKKLMISNN